MGDPQTSREDAVTLYVGPRCPGSGAGGPGVLCPGASDRVLGRGWLLGTGAERPPRLQWRRTLPGRDLPRLDFPAAQQRACGILENLVVIPAHSVHIQDVPERG